MKTVPNHSFKFILHRIFLLSSGVIFILKSGQGQFQDRYWIFGTTDGVINQTNFNWDFFPNVPDNSLYPGLLPLSLSPPPSGIGKDNSFEAWAVATDPSTGELLLYTDGIDAFDAAHNKITPQGGLGTNRSSSRGVAICYVPVCPFDNIYIFSNPTGEIGGNPVSGPVTFVTYNTVTKQFSGRSPLPPSDPQGDEAVGQGMQLIPSETDPFTFWLITRALKSDATGGVYRVYRIDPNGVSFHDRFIFGPVIPTEPDNNVPPNLDSPIMNMAYSNERSPDPDISEVAFTVSRAPVGSNRVFTCEFNNRTGNFDVGTAKVLNIPNVPTEILYDAEYSPEGKFLYYSVYFNSRLFQYDFSNDQTVEIKRNNSSNFGPNRAGGLKLGPDGFIYHIYEGGDDIVNISEASKIGRIVQPDVLYTGNNFDEMYQYEGNTANFNLSNSRSAVYNFPEFLPAPLWSVAISTEGDPIVCPGEEVSLVATVDSAGLNVEKFIWYRNDQVFDSTLIPELTVDQPGIYRLEIEFETGCTTSSTPIEVKADCCELEAPLFTNTDTTGCSGDEIVLSPVVDGATAYQWQDGSADSFFIARSPGDYSVTVTFIGDCRFSDTISVEFLTTPTINLGPDTTLCFGETITLDASNSGGTTFLWQNGSDQATYMVNTAGAFSVTVSLDGSCSVSDTVLVDYNPLQPVNLGGDVSGCTGDTIIIDATTAGAIIYNWQDGSNEAIREIVDDGIFQVTVENEDCFFSDALEVSFFPPPPENFLGNDTVLCTGESITLAPMVTGNLRWEDGSEASVRTIETPGTYALTIENGCGVFQDEINIEVTTDACEGCYFAIPNAFSPNGDGANDTFGPLTDCLFEKYSIRIFDRWGNMVYESASIDRPWDGIFKGQPAISGVYVYLIEYLRADDQEVKSTAGDVILIR